MSQDPLKAVNSRLARFFETNDPVHILDPEALVEVASLARLGAYDLNAVMALGMFHWCRYSVLPSGEDQSEIEAALGHYGRVLEAIPEPVLDHLLRRRQASPRPDRPDPDYYQELLFEAARTGDHQTFDQGIDAIRRVIVSLSGDDPIAAAFYELLGRGMRTRFKRTNDIRDLEESIASLRVVLAAGLNDDRRRFEIQTGLAAALRDRHKLLGVLHDLDEAVELYETVFRELSSSDPRVAGVAANVGDTLRTRFEAAGDKSDIDASITWLKTSSDLALSTDPNRPQFLASRGNSHQLRYRRFGDIADLGAAVGLLREAVDTGHPRPASMLTFMLGMLRDRFARGSDPADLDAAIDVGQEALTLPSAREEGIRQWLRMQLAQSYLERFDLRGDAGDLEAGVGLMQENIEALPPDAPERLVGLATARRDLALRVEPDRVPDHLRGHPLFDRAALEDPDRLMAEASVLLRWAEHADHTGAVDLAIWVIEHALPGFAPGSDEWLEARSDLGAAIGLRGERTGALGDLDEAVSIARAVLSVARPDHPRQPGFRSNLASAFRYRFRATGRFADLDAAVEMARDAAASTQHPRWAMYLSNLASLLNDRYEHLGSVTDLEEAIRVNREAVAATDPKDPNRARNLSNLAATLLGRVKTTDSETDASEAIAVQTEALSLTPAEHPSRAMRLENLGALYQFRSRLTRSAPDLEQSVQQYRQAVLARPADDPDRANSLSGLGTALLAQHFRTGDPGQLDEAIAACAEAVASSPPGHPEFQSFLGLALQTRYENAGDPQDAEAALSAYREGALTATGPVSSRLSAAQAWADLAMSLPGQRGSALTGYTVAADLLHRVAWRGLTRNDRELALTRWENLPGDMAACALAEQLPGRAVELLENSRSVIWNQMLDMRTDLSETRMRAPGFDGILTRLEEIRAALDEPGAFPMATSAAWKPSTQPPETPQTHDSASAGDGPESGPAALGQGKVGQA